MIAISSFASKSRRLLASSAALIALASNAVGLPCPPPGGETVLAAFRSSEGATIGGVTFGPDGGLYGQIFDAHGSFGSTAVYELTPPPSGSGYWLITQGYAVCFAYYCDGPPGGPLILDTSGAVYGVSTTGGIVGCPVDWQSLCGFIFRVGARTDSFYDFHGAADGYSPSGSLVLGADGSVYGTTVQGGAHGAGTAYRLTSAGIKTTIYDFIGAKGDGAQPHAGLIIDSFGALYGTTSLGGAAGKGAVFKLTPPANPSGGWTESVLYSFTGLSDGSYPTNGLTFGPSGSLYGITGSSGSLYGTNSGVAFKLTPPVPPATQWTPTVLHSFTGGADGASPVGSLVADTNGALYGATLEGGVRLYGTVFKLTPPVEPLMQWRLTTLYSFSGGQDGRTPSGGVILDNAGGLYGTTKAGGPYGGGVVFRVNNSTATCE